MAVIRSLYFLIVVILPFSSSCIRTIDPEEDTQQWLDELDRQSLLAMVSEAKRMDKETTTTSGQGMRVTSQSIRNQDTSATSSGTVSPTLLVESTSTAMWTSSSTAMTSTETTTASTVTTTTAFMCPMDGMNWIRFSGNGHCYLAVTMKKPWTEAEIYCNQIMGGHLASVEDMSENDFIYGLIRDAIGSSQFHYFIGLKALTGSANFDWSDGSSFDPMVYQNWFESEPNSPIVTDRCVAALGRWTIPTADSKWIDVVCTTTTYFVCELEGPAI